MRLTAAHLRRLGACSTTEFEKVFPNGAPLTVTSLKKARKARLDLAWLRNRLTEPRVCSGSCRICNRTQANISRVFKALPGLHKLLRVI